MTGRQKGSKIVVDDIARELERREQTKRYAQQQIAGLIRDINKAANTNFTVEMFAAVEHEILRALLLAFYEKAVQATSRAEDLQRAHQEQAVTKAELKGITRTLDALAQAGRVPPPPFLGFGRPW